MIEAYLSAFLRLALIRIVPPRSRVPEAPQFSGPLGLALYTPLGITLLTIPFAFWTRYAPLPLISAPELAPSLFTWQYDLLWKGALATGLVALLIAKTLMPSSRRDAFVVSGWGRWVAT